MRNHTTASVLLVYKPPKAEKRVVDYAVACSVNAVDQLSYDNPMFIHDNTHLRRTRWAREEAKLAKCNISSLK
jgi:hypothetical protein